MLDQIANCNQSNADVINSRDNTQKNAIDFADYVSEKFPYRVQSFRTDRGHEWQAQLHWHVEDLRPVGKPYSAPLRS